LTHPFRTSRRVEFGDTDMAGIMHFSNYFRFMEVAETAFLRSKGLSVAWSEGGQRVGFPRVSCACDYFTPALFEDVLDIDVTIEKIGTKSVTYRFDFSRRSEALAVGRISSVYCRTTPDHQIESLPIPAEVRAKLEGS
jgi:acyl-CoA thioester hydrolase